MTTPTRSIDVASQLTTNLRPIVRSRLLVGFPTVLGRSVLTAFWLALPVAAFAGPKVTVEGDVHLAGPVEVGGVVATEDELLRESFAVTKSTMVAVGDIAKAVEFSVPRGKRLVIETITCRVVADPTRDVEIYLSYDSAQGQVSSSLPVLSSTPFLTTVRYHAVHPGKVRVESGTFAVGLSSFNSNTQATLSATVFGYLVDR